MQQQQQEADLATRLADPSRPSFLFGVTPPREGTSAGECRAICAKFVGRQRALATDGFLVYDIQDESSRNDAPRPFPFRRLLDPSWYAALFEAESGKACLVYKVAPNTDSEEHFRSWVDTAVDMHRHRAFNLVGAASSSQDMKGPSVEDAAAYLRNYNRSDKANNTPTTLRRPTVRFGCVAIAERHRAKHREHENMLRKVKWGAEWFVTQGIFDADAMVELLNDYGALCRSHGLVPRKVVLTFVPCGRKKTLQFIKWLGMEVPAAAEEHIFAPPAAGAKAAGATGSPAAPVAKSTPKQAVARCCELNRANLVRILEGTSGCGVPLGLNVESVSGYRDEIEAAHHMFRDLQTVLLDHRGSPWMVCWYDVPRPLLPGLLNQQQQQQNLLQRDQLQQPRHSESDTTVAKCSSTPFSSPLAFLLAGAGLVSAGTVLGFALGRSAPAPPRK